MPDSTIQIKRYPNRRFYALHTSKYVSLQEIEELIRNGERLEIRDNRTGDDITGQVLTQILLDRQPEKVALFPTEMLHFMLRSNELVADFLRDYFRNSLTYLEYLQRHGSLAQKLTGPMHWAKAWLDGINGKSHQASAEQEGNEELVSRIEQLEERIRQLESGSEA